jgi:cyclic pyranopterin phosphate synthase
MQTKLTHINESGEAKMVDVGDKATTHRIATAKGSVIMQPETLQLIMAGNMKKGDVLTVAKIAGIQAAKRTSDLIPLCHPLPVNYIDVDCQPNPTTHSIDITATVRVSGKTGVEMEALTAVTVASLTIYDMAKAVDRAMQISQIRLAYKEGGKSGIYQETHP